MVSTTILMLNGGAFFVAIEQPHGVLMRKKQKLPKSAKLYHSESLSVEI